MAERRILVTLANRAIADLVADTLRQLDVPVTVTVGDLYGPNVLMPADVWLEDVGVLDDPEKAQAIRAVIEPYLADDAGV